MFQNIFCIYITKQFCGTIKLCTETLNCEIDYLGNHYNFNVLKAVQMFTMALFS